MGYWAYYLAILGAAYFAKYPWLLLGLVALVLGRRWIPDPWVLLRTFGRMRQLRAQIEANAANVTARRDLARLYLERLRPRSALALLDEARRRDPDDPELLYLTGLARYRAGRAQDALEPLVQAVATGHRVSTSHAYLVAGDALSSLERYDEAIDAYERYVQSNTSSIEGWTKLALAHHHARETNEARRALREARETWGQIPGFMRRKELGWFLWAQLCRLWV